MSVTVFVISDDLGIALGEPQIEKVHDPEITDVVRFTYTQQLWWVRLNREGQWVLIGKEVHAA